MRQLNWIHVGDTTHTGAERFFYCEIIRRHEGVYDYFVEIGLDKEQGTTSTLLGAMGICQNICEEITNSIMSTSP